jgi:hypothetical protein
MSQRELLQRALEALIVYGDRDATGLIQQIEYELEKPEPLECGTLEISMNIPFNTWDFSRLKEGGKYKLLAVRIEDDD